LRALTALFALAVLLSATPSALGSNASSAGAGDAGFAPSTDGSGSLKSGSSPSPCSDGKFNFLALGGQHWRQSLNWSFRASSVPAGVSPSAALSAIKRGFGNVTGARNDCGRGDNISATSSYLGTTSRKPAVTSNGSCGLRDGHNVVAFAPLGGGYAGYTCIWWDAGKIVEADMRLDSNTAWATSTSNCGNRLVMEALVTHEVGHAFGLAHVAESRHGRLTMSVYIDGLCENQEATLGLGDLRGLEALY
jgi:hypothetical protein